MKGTRELIQKTALKIFGKKGLKKTTMDDIAREARIGKGTIYHYYESKEQMFCDLLESKISESIKIIKERVTAETEPENRLRAYLSARFGVMRDFPKIFSSFREDYVNFYSYVRKSENKFADFAAAIIWQCLKEGVEKGVFEIEDIEFTVFAAMEGIKAFEYPFALEESQEEMNRKINLLINIFMKGILKR